MQQTNGLILVLIGLLLLWVVVNGKYDAFERFVYELLDIKTTPAAEATPKKGTGPASTLPTFKGADIFKQQDTRPV
jgi:hypothetical protein